MKHPKNNLSTVLESPNIILFDFICLGTTLGTILQPMNIKKAKKSQNLINSCIYFKVKLTSMGYHDGTQILTIEKYKFSAFKKRVKNNLMMILTIFRRVRKSMKTVESIT